MELKKVVSTLIVCLLVSNVALASTTATKKKTNSNTKKTTCTIKLGKFGTINIKL